MKILAVGMNYPLHVEEMRNDLPSMPVIFSKPESALVVGNKPFFYPDFSNEIHYECEVVVRINRVGKCIAEKFAHRYYDELTLGIDFTARDLQRQCKTNGWPWEIAKAFDHSAPVGVMIDKAELPPVDDLYFRLEVNGETVQRGHTADMMLSIDRLIAHISQFFTVKMGDLIFTGTPAGVGPVKIGDRLQGYLEEKLVFDFLIK